MPPCPCLKLRTVGLELDVRFGLKLIVAVIGPGTFFFTIWPVTGDIYVTTADEIVSVVPEYVPCATFVSEIGSTVPMRCIISTVVGKENNRNRATGSIGQDHRTDCHANCYELVNGPSPIFTCNAVMLVCGFEFCEVPPPQPNSNSTEKNREAHTMLLVNCVDMSKIVLITLTRLRCRPAPAITLRARVCQPELEVQKSARLRVRARRDTARQLSSVTVAIWA
jgi:hypothetical protein